MTLVSTVVACAALSTKIPAKQTFTLTCKYVPLTLNMHTDVTVHELIVAYQCQAVPAYGQGFVLVGTSSIALGHMHIVPKHGQRTSGTL